MIRALVVALLMLLGGPAWAQAVSFPSVTVGSSRAGPDVKGWIYKPPGDGPFPAIILAHSCAGVNAHTDRWGKLLDSHGGSTVIRSAQKNFGLAQRGLAAGVAYYPGCSPQFDGGIDIPVLLLAGDKDDWTPADRCRALVSGLQRGGIVDAVYYPNAYHSFDSKVADRTVPGAAGKQHHLAYDTVAAPDAEARTQAFFAKYLR